MRTLLVEDSEALQRSLSTGLRNSGYLVEQAFTGQEALAFIGAANFDVIILDLMLPGISGLEVLKQMRCAGNRSYVLILSAMDKTEDRINGLDLGADDYLVKPFAFDELLSRLRALTRRSQIGTGMVANIINVPPMSIDISKRLATVNNVALALTPSEYKIIETLAKRCGQVFTHDQLISNIYEADQSVSRNTIEAHVSSLRKKLREQGAPNLVQTRRGFGYYIDN